MEAVTTVSYAVGTLTNLEQELYILHIVITTIRLPYTYLRLENQVLISYYRNHYIRLSYKTRLPLSYDSYSRIITTTDPYHIQVLITITRLHNTTLELYILFTSIIYLLIIAYILRITYHSRTYYTLLRSLH